MTNEPHTDEPHTEDAIADDPIAQEQVAHHDAATHMDEHTTLSDDDHGHAGEALGPIDWGKWGFAIAGGVGGLIVLAFFLLAIGGTL